MSTALTKVIETAKGFNLWTKTWWMRVPEPRDISFLFSLAYLVTLDMGFMAFLAPPQSVKGVTGPIIMGTIGVFLIAGSLLGMWSGAKEIWALERMSIWLMGGGVFVYGLNVLYLHTTTPGPRLLQLGVVTLTLLLFILRYRLIRIFARRPRG